MEIAPLPFFGQQRKAIFIYLMAVAKLVVWWFRVKGMKTNISLFDLPLFAFRVDKVSTSWTPGLNVIDWFIIISTL